MGRLWSVRGNVWEYALSLNIVLEGNLRALVGGRGEARVFLSTRRLGSDLTIVTTALDPMVYVLRRDDSD